MKPAVGGVNVPAFPIATVGHFYSRDQWDGPWHGMLTPSAFASAVRAKVFTVERKGPRGGEHFAIISGRAWHEWRTKYVQLCQARVAGEALRRLNGTFNIPYHQRMKLQRELAAQERARAKLQRNNP